MERDGVFKYHLKIAKNKQTIEFDFDFIIFLGNYNTKVTC